MPGTIEPRRDGGEARAVALALDPRLAWVAARRALASGPRGGAAAAPAADPAAALATLARLGGRLVTIDHGEFPAALRELPGGPVGLFVRGALPPGPAVAIVGARACSGAAAALARDLAAAAVAAGRVVVSGGAIGVDAAAHDGALRAGGRTVAVLGSGLDRPYPTRNLALFDRIAAQGAVVTPFPPGTAPLRANFPRRNLIVAALAEHVVVVEARGRSGALITARAARGLGRALAAVPGTAGCDQLLAGGAARLAGAADLGPWLRGETPPPVTVAAPTPEAAAALAACDATPRGVAVIAARAGLAEDDAQVALAFLELWGLVVRVRSEQYVRVGSDAPATPSTRKDA